MKLGWPYRYIACVLLAYDKPFWVSFVAFALIEFALVADGRIRIRGDRCE